MKKMKRRQFLKMISGGIACTVLPLPGTAQSVVNLPVTDRVTAHKLADGQLLRLWINDKEVDPKQVQALESRRYTVDECARIFNIPPHMLNSIASLKSKDIEDQHLEFITTTIQPWFRKWEQAPEAQAATERALINNKS